MLLQLFSIYEKAINVMKCLIREALIASIAKIKTAILKNDLLDLFCTNQSKSDKVR